MTQPAHDHTAGRAIEVTKVSPLPRRHARINACTEMAAIVAGIPITAPLGGTYSVIDDPQVGPSGRIEITVRAGEFRFTRGRHLPASATKADKDAARAEMIDELFEYLLKLAARSLDKPKPPEEWKTLPLGQRVLGFLEMLFVAFAFLFDWRPKGKRGAK